MLTRILYTQIWTDDFFTSLNKEEKLLFIYFLTNDQVNILHLYQCSLPRVSADTGIDTPIIEKAKDKFERAGKMFFKDGFIFLKNSDRYEKYEGSKNEIAKEKVLSRLSEKIIAWYNNVKNTPIDTPIDTPPIGSINHNTEIINNKSEIRDHKSEIINIDIEEKQKIAERYGVPISFVESKVDDLLNWHEQNPRKNKRDNYVATLRNWVKRDAIHIVERQQNSNYKYSVTQL